MGGLENEVKPCTQENFQERFFPHCVSVQQKDLFQLGRCTVFHGSIRIPAPQMDSARFSENWKEWNNI